MIYICLPALNEASTVGLLLWRIRQVFTDFPREYRLLVADDASADATPDVLEPYARALPLTVVRHQVRAGAARCVEELLRLAVDDSDRPKRDCAIVMHTDFTHEAQLLPDIVRAIEGGSDLVAVEGDPQGLETRGERWVRRYGSTLLTGAVGVPGVKDLLSGFFGVRLAAAKTALRPDNGPFVTTTGWAARAEILARLAAPARRIDAITGVERHDLRQRGRRHDPWTEAKGLLAARSRLRRIPRAKPSSTPTDRSPQREPAAVEAA